MEKIKRHWFCCALSLMVALKQFFQVLLLMPPLLWGSNPDKPRCHYIVFTSPVLLTMPSPQHPPPCKTSAPICENAGWHRHIWWGTEMGGVSTAVRPQCRIVNRGPPTFPPSPVSHSLLARLPIHGHATAKATSHGHDIQNAEHLQVPPQNPHWACCGKSRLYLIFHQDPVLGWERCGKETHARKEPGQAEPFMSHLGHLFLFGGCVNNNKTQTTHIQG